jgi:2-polyprenyl-3-methyl-5-hydroxy-6-metoxy-1,4-benzoquinol methylase
MDEEAPETPASRFDALAAGWDIAPQHVDRTRDVVRLVRERIPLAGRSALEVGAGTGLLSFALSPELRSVLATDPSPGMVAVLEDKIRQSGSWNVRALRVGDDLAGVEGPFGLVMLQMALHHVSDPSTFLVRAASLLEPGGYLAVADLDREDGSFHGPEVADVHRGFERTEIVSWLADAGLEPVSVGTAHSMRRTAGGVAREYPIFLAIARRS